MNYLKYGTNFELNINALSEIYNLNATIFKEFIGSLNWKKFAERLQTSLKESSLQKTSRHFSSH